MGLSSVRNDILQCFLPEPIRPHVQLGETFGSESNVNQLLRYMQQSLSRQFPEKRFLIFSGINRPQSGETHYQGFIIDYIEKKVYVADPAMTTQGRGIYHPYLAQQQVIPFYQTHGFTAEFINATHPCQTHVEDVFCQSWTLYLMIQFLTRRFSGNESPIPIPPAQIRRYSLLLQFYRSILNEVDNVCDLLKETYLYNVSRHRSLVSGLTNPKERKERRNLYKSIDPCAVLMRQMKPSDMSDDE